MKLNLGCCDAAIPGFVNVDLVAGPGVDQVADLSKPWPWADNSIEYVRAWDIIEHLPDKIQTMMRFIACSRRAVGRKLPSPPRMARERSRTRPRFLLEQTELSLLRGRQSLPRALCQ